jgi:UDP-N-acetylmuramate dehydrogenase
MWSDMTVHTADDGALLLRVGAGARWAELAERAVAEGWSGFEALVGIPGSVGAAPVQNIGAYGHEIAELIASVTVWDRLAGTVRTLGRADLAFGYRTSAIKNPVAGTGRCAAHGPPPPTHTSATPDAGAPATHSGTSNGGSTSPRIIVLSVDLRTRVHPLSAPIGYPELARALDVRLGERAPLADVAQAVLGLRRSKGMLVDREDHDTWSAGSFFTNPILPAARAAELLPADAPRFDAGLDESASPLVKTSAAWLISHAGIGRGWGLNRRATTSTKHVLALTNRGGATARDIHELAAAIATRVEAAFGVTLTPEPTIL